MNVSSFLQNQELSTLFQDFSASLFSGRGLHAGWCWGGARLKMSGLKQMASLSLLFGSWGPQWLPEDATLKNHNKVAEALRSPIALNMIEKVCNLKSQLSGSRYWGHNKRPIAPRGQGVMPAHR